MSRNNKKTNLPRMRLSYRIEDEYGNTIQSINGAPLEQAINKLKGTLNTKINRASGKSRKYNDMMKGL